MSNGSLGSSSIRVEVAFLVGFHIPISPVSTRVAITVK